MNELLYRCWKFQTSDTIKYFASIENADFQLKTHKFSLGCLKQVARKILFQVAQLKLSHLQWVAQENPT